MTDKDRFLSELKLLCNKYGVTLGAGKQYMRLFGEEVLIRRYPVFVSIDFSLDLETEVYWYLRDSDDLERLGIV
jgi:hypothetical protein